MAQRQPHIGPFDMRAEKIPRGSIGRQHAPVTDDEHGLVHRAQQFGDARLVVDWILTGGRNCQAGFTARRRRQGESGRAGKQRQQGASKGRAKQAGDKESGARNRERAEHPDRPAAAHPRSDSNRSQASGRVHQARIPNIFKQGQPTVEKLKKRVISYS
ncbi:MAG: hypothetical protein ACXWUX_05735 [Allosphingosinicella sp.]